MLKNIYLKVVGKIIHDASCNFKEVLLGGIQMKCNRATIEHILVNKVEVINQIVIVRERDVRGESNDSDL